MSQKGWMATNYWYDKAHYAAAAAVWLYNFMHSMSSLNTEQNTGWSRQKKIDSKEGLVEICKS